MGSTLRIPWFLTHRSTRPGEEPGTTRGVLDVRVVAERARFTVTAQPGRGPPGKEVTLTITPAVPGISIVRCIGFFPNDAGGTCQATDERRLVRTGVPKGTPPGTTLLRWGVDSVDQAGAPLSDNGALPFEVLPLPGTTASPGPSPARSPTRSPTTLPPIESPAPLPTATAEGPPPPAFVARTDPEAAEPGQPVSLSVSALTPGTAITGCRTAFRGKQVVPCDDTGGVWTATLTVPDDAEPGDLPLLWDVTSRTGSGKGTIAYRVLGDTPPEPQFGVVIEPASVRPGEHVLVTHQSYDSGPAINGCTAGIARSLRRAGGHLGMRPHPVLGRPADRPPPGVRGHARRDPFPQADPASVRPTRTLDSEASLYAAQAMKRGAHVWDWDAEQVAKKKTASSGHTGKWVGGGVGALIALIVLFRLLFVLVAQHTDEVAGGRPALGGAPASQRSFESDEDEDEVQSAADMFFGGGLRARNADPRNMGPAETLELISGDNEMQLTPGAVRIRSDACSNTSFVAIAMTVSSTRGSMAWDPAALRLVDSGGREEPLLTECVQGVGASAMLDAGHQVTGELAFLAASPVWLVYAPNGGPVVGRWRLS